jgi:polyferredoxin
MDTKNITRRLILFLSFVFFSFTFVYMSPYLAVFGSIFGIFTCGLLFWVIFLVASFLVGRAPCGWICPLGALQEYTDDIVHRKLVKVPGLPWLRNILFVGWAGAIVILAARAGGFHRFSLTGGFAPLLPPYDAPAYVIFYGMLITMPLMVFILGKRAFCRYLCFFGMPLGRIGAFWKQKLGYSSLQLRCDVSLCKKCGLCDKYCVNSVPVGILAQNGIIEHRECILCGQCVAHCPTRALRFAWGKRKEK